MKLVVRSQGGQGAGADAVREENLGRAVYPRAGIEQFLPSRRHVVKQALVGTLQRHRSYQKNEKHHVREQGWKPDDLTALMNTAPDDKINEEPADDQTAKQLKLKLADILDTGSYAKNPLTENPIHFSVLSVCRQMSWILIFEVSRMINQRD